MFTFMPCVGRHDLLNAGIGDAVVSRDVAQSAGPRLYRLCRQSHGAGRSVRRYYEYERRVLRLLRSGDVPRCIIVQRRCQQCLPTGRRESLQPEL